MKFLDRPDCQLYYHDAGPERTYRSGLLSPDPATRTPDAPDAPAIVLLAGMASDGASWQPILPRLRSSFRVITLDNRGTGQTTPTDAPVSRSLMVDDVIAVLDALQLETVVLVGHSMGAMLAWAIAAAVPERVAGLVAAAAPMATLPARIELFETLARLRTESNEADWFRLLFQFLFSDRFFEDRQRVDDAVNTAMTYPFRQSITAFRRQTAALHSFLIAPQVDHVDCPVMAMTGTNDVLFNPTSLTFAYEGMPQVSRQIVADAAHALHWEAPDRFCECVEQFMTSLD